MTETEAFFEIMGLKINPAKSEIVFFGEREPRVSLNLLGVSKDLVPKAKYLGVVFEADGRWETQINDVLLSTKLAVGRCKIMARTINMTNVKRLLELYDSMVSSIVRYSAGIWAAGSQSNSLHKFDEVFVEFFRSVFRLPRTTSKKGLLLNLGRRCCYCDSIFLAACQLARGQLEGLSLWSCVLKIVELGGSRWFNNIKIELERRGLFQIVVNSPENFLGERKVWADRFSQYCYHNHLLELRPNSSITFSHRRPFGIYPFVFELDSYNVRSILIFTLSCWRWSLKNVSRYPEYCERCDCENNSSHLLFRCQNFLEERDTFVHESGAELNSPSCLINENIGRPLAKFCQKLCTFIEMTCESIVH